MARTLGSVCRLCRRAGEKLFLKGAKCETPKCPITRRNYPPGQHGPMKGFGKISEYGRQLREKQKAKRIYGIGERQFKLYYEKADQSTGITGDELLKSLEKRLDNVLYRASFTSSRIQARQLVGHGHVFLNGKKVSVPSIQVKVNDKFEIKERSKKIKLFEELKTKKDTSPKWMKVDYKNLTGEILREPDHEDLDKSVAASLIVEYYSK